MTENFDAVRKPLYATVGAYDAALAAVADVVAQVRARAENTSTDVSGRVDEARERFAALPADVQEQVEALRERLAGLPSELPEDIADLREKFTAEELRKAAESYLKVALDLYSDLAERGEETVERLRSRAGVNERMERVEGIYNDAVSLTEEAISRVSERTRELGEQAAKLTGRGGDKAAEKTDEATDTAADVVANAPAPAPVTKTPVTKTPATTTPAPAPVTDTPAPAPVKKAPAASKTPAKKAPAKKAPAKKAPAKKAPGTRSNS